MVRKALLGLVMIPDAPLLAHNAILVQIVLRLTHDGLLSSLSRVKHLLVRLPWLEVLCLARIHVHLAVTHVDCEFCLAYDIRCMVDLLVLLPLHC